MQNLLAYSEFYSLGD